MKYIKAGGKKKATVSGKKSNMNAFMYQRKRGKK